MDFSDGEMQREPIKWFVSMKMCTIQLEESVCYKNSFLFNRPLLQGTLQYSLKLLVKRTIDLGI